MTTPEAPASTTVSFTRAGVVVAQATVPGHLLELDLPATVTVQRRQDGSVDLMESDDPLLECCGRLALPWLSRLGPGTAFIDVPPPAPFDEADVDQMWSARNRLTALHRPPTSGDADWARLRRTMSSKVDWQALEQAVTAAASLLGAWPTRQIPTVAWLPFDRTGGRLLIGATERAARSHTMPAGATGAPAMTARRVTTAQDTTVHALTAVAALLGSAICVIPGLDAEPEMHDRLVGLFRRVADRSNPRRPVADPPPSAWPATIVATYSACLRALTAVTAVAAGNDSGPLSELWELYEAWCADSLRSALSASLGPSQRVPFRGSLIGRWTDGAATVELHYQAVVPAVGSLQILGRSFTAVISELKPDLLLVRRDTNQTRVLVLDPKKRAAVLTSDDLTVNASKYLWGIRDASTTPLVPSVVGVVLMAPLGGATSARKDGLASTMTAHPKQPVPKATADQLLQRLS